MPTLTKGYYHCLECGAVFEAALKSPNEQRCPICGNPPTGKILAGTAQDRYASTDRAPGEFAPRPAGKLHGVNHDTQDIYEATMATMSAQKDSRNGRVKRTKRRAKKSKKQWLLIGVWIVAMLCVVGLVKYFGDDDSESSSLLVDSEAAEREAATQEKKRGLIIEAAVPACEQTMTEFFNAPSAASKAQFVYQGVKLSGVMNRYYRDAISFSLANMRVKIVRAELLDGFSMRALGALCVNTKGEKWEAVFVQEGNEWKIDWKSLVRYDERSWSLFPAGNEGDEGEFRLYLRVRDSNEDFQQKEMSLVFYKPTMFVKDKFRGVASTPVRVVIDSELGQKITALLNKDKEKEGSSEMVEDAHGLKIGYMDPSRYHRVKIKMRLHKEGKGNKKARMELLEILANDWYGIQMPDDAASETEVEKSEG